MHAQKESVMPLDGTNKKCEQCQEKCKQWRQVTIIHCPFFRSKQSLPTPSAKAGTTRMTSGTPFSEDEHST